MSSRSMSDGWRENGLAWSEVGTYIPFLEQARIMPSMSLCSWTCWLYLGHVNPWRPLKTQKPCDNVLKDFTCFRTTKDRPISGRQCRGEWFVTSCIWERLKTKSENTRFVVLSGFGRWTFVKVHVHVENPSIALLLTWSYEDCLRKTSRNNLLQSVASQQMRTS